MIDEKMKQRIVKSTASNFSISSALRKVNISRGTFDLWRNKDPGFAKLIDEINWHKKNFFEDHLCKLLEWMIKDMRHRADDDKRNYEAGSQGDYSPELNEAINLLKELNDPHHYIASKLFKEKGMIVNCREFNCLNNDKGECRLEKIVLQKAGPIIGQLVCAEAEEQEEEPNKPNNTGLIVGTKIRFKKTLTSPANEDHPDCIYAEKDELGTITEVGGCREGYWVKTNAWPNPFGCESKDFEVLKET